MHLRDIWMAMIYSSQAKTNLGFRIGVPWGSVWPTIHINKIYKIITHCKKEISPETRLKTLLHCWVWSSRGVSNIMMAVILKGHMVQVEGEAVCYLPVKNFGAYKVREASRHFTKKKKEKKRK